MQYTKAASRVRGRFFFTRGYLARFAVGLLGFFIGRAVLFDMINPIAVAYLAALLGTTNGGFAFYLSAVFLALGVATKLTGAHLVRYIICFGAMCIINIFIHYFIVRKNKLYFTGLAQSAVGTLAVLAGGVTTAYISNFSASVIFITIMESALVFFLVFILKKSALVITSAKRRSTLTNEEVISLAVLFGAIIAGAADIHLGVISLRYLLCFYFVLMAVWIGDAAVACAAGMLTGLLLCVVRFWGPPMAVVLAVAGLGAGLFKQQGKLTIIAAFTILGGGAFYYLAPSLISVEVACSLGFAAILFIVTPWKFNFFVTAHINPIMDNAQEYANKIKDTTVERLNTFSDSFGRLGRIFGGMAERHKGINRQDIAYLLDDIAVSVCKDCSNRADCWEARYPVTSQNVVNLLGVFERVGKADIEHVQWCVTPRKFLEGANKLFAAYKTDAGWKNTLAEGRDLVSQQLIGVSGVIKHLAEDMNKSLRFHEELEEKILISLSNSNIEAHRVVVMENKSGRYEVQIRHKFFIDKERWDASVVKILSAVLKRPMQAEDLEKSMLYVTRFIERKKFDVSCGVARQAKGKKQENGDSYSYKELNSGEVLMALSDGMGTGRRANEESAAAVDLLENFLEAGFEKSLAIKIINSALVLRNSSESFATLDICTVDLYTGNAEFVKIGAASSFLLRDGKVFVIRSTSLPIGMLKDVDMELSRRDLKDDDILLMVTDGLLDIADEYGDKEDWIDSALTACKLDKPQDIADFILLEAKRLCAGVIPDDMTVLAASIKEK